MVGNQSPFLFEVRTIGQTVEPAQHRCKQGIRFPEPFNGVKFIFPLGKFKGFIHLGLQHLVKIVPRLGNFNKICIKELPKRFEGVNSHKGFRAEVGQLHSGAGVKGTVF